MKPYYKEINNLYIESSPVTPQIDFNYLTGELLISGKSFPENAAGFYEEIFQWVHKYTEGPRAITNLRLNLEYFNTSSLLWLAQIVKLLNSIHGNERTLFIHIYFHIEEYENMGTDDLRNTLGPILDIIENHEINLFIKIYGTVEDGEVLKESMVLI